MLSRPYAIFLLGGGRCQQWNNAFFAITALSKFRGHPLEILTFLKVRRIFPH